MAASKSDYAWSDVWFLLAVEYATRNGKPASLSKIIDIGDAMNKAILSTCEIKSATFKLTRDKWIRFKNGQFTPLQKTKRQFRNLPKVGHPMCDQFTVVRSWLNATDYSEKNNRPSILTSEDFPAITDKMVKDAVSEYKRRFAKRHRITTR